MRSVLVLPLPVSHPLLTEKHLCFLQKSRSTISASTESVIFFPFNVMVTSISTFPPLHCFLPQSYAVHVLQAPDRRSADIQNLWILPVPRSCPLFFPFVSSCRPSLRHMHILKEAVYVYFFARCLSCYIKMCCPENTSVQTYCDLRLFPDIIRI